MLRVSKKKLRHWILVALLASIGLIAVVRFWNEPTKVQAVAAFLTFLATLLLLGVTKDYADVTREVAEANRSVYLDYWLEHSDQYIAANISPPMRRIEILVANLSANVVAIKRHFVRIGQDTFFEERQVVRSGELVRLTFPMEYLARLSGEVRCGIKLQYVSAGRTGETQFKFFRLQINNNQIATINEGLAAHLVTPVKIDEDIQS
jgi:hypothetical protein